MTRPLHQDLAHCLTGETPPRVWSLLVTVFGDLAQAPGTQVSSRALSVLCDAIGVKPAALRVALHRLRKDGWIESHRDGRQSLHRLTETGLRQSIAATPRIYGVPVPAGRAFLSVFDRNSAADGAAGVWVAPNTLISADDPSRADAFTTRLHPEVHLPGWMADKLCPPETLAHALAFARRLDRCTELLSTGPCVSTLDVAVLRVLVVHGWRRIVLKLPELPDHVFPAAWPGAACRSHVQRLLAQHPRVDLAHLDPQTKVETE